MKRVQLVEVAGICAMVGVVAMIMLTAKTPLDPNPMQCWGARGDQRIPVQPRPGWTFHEVHPWTGPAFVIWEHHDRNPSDDYRPMPAEIPALEQFMADNPSPAAEDGNPSHVCALTLQRLEYLFHSIHSALWSFRPAIAERMCE